MKVKIEALQTHVFISRQTLYLNSLSVTCENQQTHLARCLGIGNHLCDNEFSTISYTNNNVAAFIYLLIDTLFTSVENSSEQSLIVYGLQPFKCDKH